MAGARGTIEKLTHEIVRAFGILKQVIAAPDAFYGLMRELGWSAADIPAPIQGLATAIDAVDEAIGRLLADEPSPAEFESARLAVVDLHAAIVGLASASFPAELAADGFASQFPDQLIQYVVIEHMRREHPRLATLLKALGILRITFQPAHGNRPTYMRRERAPTGYGPGLGLEAGPCVGRSTGWPMRYSRSTLVPSSFHSMDLPSSMSSR
jgi:hypothetical protein